MLEIRLLGQFKLCMDGTPVEISSRPARILLTYLLITRGTEHPRERLAGVLWPESSESNARKNLRQALWRLRKVIGEPNLVITSDSIGFNPASEYWLDLEVLEETDGEELHKALLTYEGELLPGYYEDWLLLERDRLASIYNQKMHHLMDDLCEQHEWASVIEWAERWIASENCAEAAYRAQMKAYAALGEFSNVEATYRRCVHALDTYLGVSPSNETELLHTQIFSQRDGTVSRGPLQSEVSVVHAEFNANLPVPTTAFIGRKQELREVQEQFKRTRLLTITGPGGIGKTRLALHLASQMLEGFSDGCCFISLAPISDAGSLTQRIAEALRFPLATQDDPEQQLFRFLQNKNLLLVMDNFEHILEGAITVSEILRSAPDVKILTTSRARLNLHGEAIYPLEGLSLVTSEDIEIPNSEAVELFLQSSIRVQPNFAPTNEDLKTIEEICELVQGMPLAIELAAAWIQVLTIGEVFQELSKGLDLLEAEVRDAPPRHRSIRAVFNHSWNLLNKAERDVFVRLSVFRGGFTRAAAEAVADGTLKSLVSLVNKSFLSHDAETGRYEMHELVRQFAREMLEKKSDLLASAQSAHAAFYGQFMEASAKDLRGHKQLPALRYIKADIENIRLAWRYYLHRLDADGIWKFITGLWHVYYILWMNHAGKELFAEAVVVLGREESEEIRHLQALAMAHQAFFMGWLELSQEGYELARQSVAVLENSNLQKELVLGYESVVVNAYFLGTFLEEHAVIKKMVSIAHQIGDTWLEAFTSFPLGMAALMQGKYEEAGAIARRNLEAYEDLGDIIGSTMHLIILGHSRFARNDLDEAKAIYLECLARADRVHFHYSIQTATKYLGKVFVSLGQVDKAREFLCRSLQITREIGFMRDIVNLCYEFARVFVMEKEYSHAVELLAAVIEQPVSAQKRLFEGRIRDSAMDLLGTLERELDASDYSTLLERGRTASLEELVNGLLLQAID